jgi:DNA-binding NarL/FixJ family response regulator
MAAAARPVPVFTPLRAEVLELAAAGLVDKEIARRLGLAQGTVRSRLAACADATGLHRRAALVAAWLLSDACTPAHRERLRRRLAWAASAAAR